MLQANEKELYLSDLKMPEITPRKWTDIRHTEHDLRQLTTGVKWMENCMYPTKDLASVSS